MPDLLAERKGGLVVVTLNRPDSLNALNFFMIRELARVMDKAESDDRIFAVVLRGAGDRAFCAGGDIKAAREGGLAWKEGHRPLEDTLQFFVEEYALNRRLFHFPKPVIAIMDGITMGGGVGLAAPCQYRIATTRTRWAMPEVGIGFFPDVGAGYYLSRMPDHIGYYLGVTGLPVASCRDMMSCKIATHFMPSEMTGSFIAALAEATSADKLVRVIKSINIMKDQPRTIDTASIRKYFSLSTIEDIVHAMEWAENDDWAYKTAQLIRAKSPTSVKVAFAHIKKAETQEFDQVSHRDLYLAEAFMRGEDFYEGVRAAVVDKDRKPKWSPAQLEQVGAVDLP